MEKTRKFTITGRLIFGSYNVVPIYQYNNYLGLLPGFVLDFVGGYFA